MTESTRLVAAGIILDGEGRALLLRRSADDFLGGLYELPSGVVHDGETVEDGLARELLEETGLSVAGIGCELTPFNYQSRSGRQTVQRTFVVRVEEGPVTLSEHDDSAWLPADELEAVLASPEVKALIRDAMHHGCGHVSSEPTPCSVDEAGH